MWERDREAFSAWTVGAVAIALLGVGLAAVAASQTGTVAEQRATTWIEASGNPVQDPSGGASSPSVVLDGGIYRMWFTGSSAGGSGLEMSTSVDGVTWSTPQDASQGLDWINDRAHVERVGDHYRVWYWEGSIYDISAIRTATSTDGLTWDNDQPIQQVEDDVVAGGFTGAWNSGVLGLDAVIHNPAGSDTIVEPEDRESVLQNTFIGLFANTDGGREHVGLAVSADGVTWEAYRDGIGPVFEPSEDGWDARHVYPSSVAVGEGFHLWYSGGDDAYTEGIGYAHSSNLIDWERAEDPIFHADDGAPWRSEATYAPAVLPATGQMWFTGEGSDGEPAVGAAQGIPLGGAS